MTPALYEVMTVHISAGSILLGQQIQESISGYTIVYMEGNDDGSGERDIDLPDLEEGQSLNLKVEARAVFTQPPPVLPRHHR